MKRATSWVVTAVLLTAAGCAGGNENAAGAGQPSTTTTAAPGAGGSGAAAAAAASVAPVPIVPLRISTTAPDGGAGHTLEMRADGAIVADGQPRGRFDGRVLADENGNELFRIADDGAITTPRDPSGRARLTASGEIVGRNSRMAVAADGSIEERHTDGRVERAPFRFDAMPANGQRAAAVMTLWMLMPVNVTTSDPTTVSTPPEATPGTGLDGGASADASAADASRDAGRRRRR